MSSALPGLVPPKPIPMKERSSIIFVEYGQIDVIDGAFVVVDKTGISNAYSDRRLRLSDAGARHAD